MPDCEEYEQFLASGSPEPMENPITDENDWFAFDHDSDANSRRIFTQMVGPNVPAGLRVGSEANPVGDAADTVVTIADILGINRKTLSTKIKKYGLY